MKTKQDNIRISKSARIARRSKKETGSRKDRRQAKGKIYGFMKKEILTNLKGELSHEVSKM